MFVFMEFAVPSRATEVGFFGVSDTGHRQSLGCTNEDEYQDSRCIISVENTAIRNRDI